MCLGGDHNVNQALILFVSLVNVNIAKICHMCLHHALSDLDVDDSFLIS